MPKIVCQNGDSSVDQGNNNGNNTYNTVYIVLRPNGLPSTFVYILLDCCKTF